MTILITINQLNINVSFHVGNDCESKTCKGEPLKIMSHSYHDDNPRTADNPMILSKKNGKLSSARKQRYLEHCETFPFFLAAFNNDNNDDDNEDSDER